MFLHTFTKTQFKCTHTLIYSQTAYETAALKSDLSVNFILRISFAITYILPESSGCAVAWLHFQLA